MLSSLVELKSPQEIEIMREGARLTLDIIKSVRDQIRVGMSTFEVDQLVAKEVKARGTTSAFLHYQPDASKNPYPSNACLCVNHEVFHAPGDSNKKIIKGDLLTIDMGILHKGLYADCADTLLIGDSNVEKLHLIQTCSKAIQAALPVCVPGGNVKEVTKMIDKTIRSEGFFPVDNFGGHGIGTSLHQAPYISNSIRHVLDCELALGMVICLEPATSMRFESPLTEQNQWTISLSTGNLSAHVERMIVVTTTGGVILQ